MTKQSIEIRPCLVEDIDAVLALWVRSEAVPRPTDHPAALKKRLERGQELFVIATDGSQVVGSLMRGGTAG